MPKTIALILCIAFVAILTIVDRKRDKLSSNCLWLPTIWMFYVLSRPMGRWSSAFYTDANFQAGNPYDRYFSIFLCLVSIILLSQRRFKWGDAIKNNQWLLILIIYSGLSVIWSDYNYISIKRWIRLASVIPILMLILTEKDPFEAGMTVFRRCVYVSIPFSYLFIKYFPELGRAYGRWSGAVMWTGVATTKNGLGQICLFAIFYLVWDYFRNRRDENSVYGYRDFFLNVIIVFLAYIMMLGGGSYSATSFACLIFVLVALLLLYKNKNRLNLMAKIVVISPIILWILLMVSNAFVEDVANLFGRKTTFTGRTDIWEMVLNHFLYNPILGTGFGGYFGIENEFWVTWHYNTAHNGILDVLVECGIIGVALLIILLIKYYSNLENIRIIKYDLFIFEICFLAIFLIINYTESLFLKSTSYFWNIFLLLFLLPKYVEQKSKIR